MKKIAIAVVVIMALMIGAFVGWLSGPSVENETPVSEAVSAARERYSLLQREAKNPEVNAYLAEEFLPLWGPDGVSDAEAPVTIAVVEWARVGGGNDVEHEALVKERTSEYADARKKFEAVLPPILAELKKPLFAIPQEEVNNEFKVPNLNNLRNLGLAVKGYVRSKVAEQKASETVKPVAALFTLGGKMQGRETLINDMLGITLQRSAFQALGQIPSDALESSEWLKLAMAVEQGLPPADQMRRAFESEINLSLSTIGKMEDQAALDGSPLSSQFLAREKRILLNQLTDQLQALEAGTLSEYSPPESGTKNWFLGKSGNLAAMQASDIARSGRLMTLNRKSLIGAQTVLDIRAYHGKYGKYPSDLEELSQMGLEPPAEPLEYDAKAKTVLVPLSEEVRAAAKPGELDVEGWSEVTENGLLLQI